VDGQSDPEFDFYGFLFDGSGEGTSPSSRGSRSTTYPNAKKSQRLLQGHLRAQYRAETTPIGGLKLTPKLYYDFVLKGPTAEITRRLCGAADRALSTELDFHRRLRHLQVERTFAPNNTPGHQETGATTTCWAWALPFQVNKESKFTIGWAYTKGSNNFLKQGSGPPRSPTSGRPRPAAS